MMKNLLVRCAFVALFSAGAMAHASTTVLMGRLDDAANTVLVGSDLGEASFDGAAAEANNVALYSFSVAVDGAVTIDSSGFALGGVDPYFSLFRGTGATAAFIASNYDQAFSTGGDFHYGSTLAAGDYVISIGAFANMSFAENLGSGTLGDGFIGLGEESSLGDGSYRIAVTTPVPEPGSAGLLLVGLALLPGIGRIRKAQRR